MPDSGYTYLDTLKRQLVETGDPVAANLVRLVTQLEDFSFGAPEVPHRAMVFDPLLDQVVYSAETLLDLIENPPLGSPLPEIPTLRRVIPRTDVDALRSAEAILRRRAGTGDAHLADLMAIARVHGQAPAEGTQATAWVRTIVAAARALCEAGAGARREIPGPRDGGENVEPA